MRTYKSIQLSVFFITIILNFLFFALLPACSVEERNTTEIDSGSDGDSDGDSDTDSDTDSDADTDTDSDADSDADADSDSDPTDDDTCPYTCSSHCLSIGGEVMEGDCADSGQKCCQLPGDSEADTSGDVDTSNDDTGSNDTSSENGDDVRVTATSASTLKDAGENASPSILIGAAISSSGLGNWSYKNVAAKEFNYVTCENEMKWSNVEGTEGWFDYSAGDNIVNFASQNGMKVKGHTLVWHNQLPGWVSSLSGRDRVMNAMKNHIKNMMDHYQGKVYAWDVVNEAVATDSDTGDGNPRMRDSVFYTQIGEDYLDIAFNYAREQDADVKLYYNDYSIDALNEKADFAYEMVKGMVERGVAIDGVGFQMHIGPPNNYADGADVAANFKRFTDLGLEVLISEMDINTCGDQISFDDQYILYHDIVAACVENPKCVAITFWGINDGSSWLSSWNGTLCNGANSYGLLFDDQFQSKPPYDTVLDALLGN